MPRVETPDLLTTQQVAEILGIHPATLSNWRVRREGPPWIKVGDKKKSPVRYRRADIDAYLENQQS